MNLRKDVTHIQWNIHFEIHLFSVICIFLCFMTAVIYYLAVFCHCSIKTKKEKRLINVFIYIFTFVLSIGSILLAGLSR